MRKFLSTFIAMMFVWPSTDANAQFFGEVGMRIVQEVAESKKELDESTRKKNELDREEFENKCAKIKEQLTKEFEEGNTYKDGKSFDELWKHTKYNPEFEDLYFELKENATYAEIAKKTLSLKGVAGIKLWKDKNGGKNYLNSQEFIDACHTLANNLFRQQALEKRKSDFFSRDLNSYETLRYTRADIGNCKITQNGNIPISEQTTCNKLDGVVSDKNNLDLMELLSSLSAVEVEKPYRIIGNSYYCNTCLEEAYHIAIGDDNAKFADAKAIYEKKITDQLAAERVKAAFMKASSYLEKLEKIKNLNDFDITEEEASDFYCSKEIDQAMTNCPEGKEQLFTALKDLKICDGYDCNQLSGYSLSVKFQEKISKREEGTNGKKLKPAACYELKTSQLQSTNSYFVLSSLFDVIGADKIMSVQTHDEPYKNIASLISKLGKNKKEFPEIAHVYEYIQRQGLNRNDKQKKDKDTPEDEQKVRAFFWKTFVELPELEMIFKDKSLFNSEWSRFEKLENKNKSFLKYLNRNMKSEINDLNLMKERISKSKTKACGQLARNLEQSMCFGKNDLSSFGSQDIAYAAEKVMDKEGYGDNLVHDSNKVALASVSCNLRNKLSSDKPTIGDPANYLRFPSNYARSNSKEYASEDDVLKYGEICKDEKGPHGELNQRKLALTPMSLSDLNSVFEQNHEADVAKADNSDNFLESYSKQEANAEFKDSYYVSNNSGYASNDYLCTDNFCGNTAQGSAGSGGGQKTIVPVLYLKPAGVTLSEPSLPTELPDLDLNIPSSLPVSTEDVSANTDESNTTGHETTNSFNSVNPISNESVNSNPFESLMTTQNNNNAIVPNYNSYSMNNYSIPQKKLSAAEKESRKETMKGIYKDFPETFSSEQLEGLSNDQLEELLSFAKEKSSEEKTKLEAEKAKFEEEKAQFEKEKIQAEIAELEEKKKKLLEENEVIARAPAANESEDNSILKSSSTRDSTPKVETDKMVINNISQSADNFNRQGEISNQVGQESFTSGATNTSTTGVSGAMNSSTTGATIAALREYGTSYSSGGANTAEQVDSYLKYVQDNHVQASELVKRGPAGEVVELIIPNSKGELVSLDMTSLSAEERKKLEEKIEKLIALEDQAGGIKLGSGAKVKFGSEVLFNQVKDIDEKIFELQNQYQETYLSDLKQQLLDAMIAKK